MSNVVMVTASGEEHGLINTIGNSVKDDGFKRFEEKDRAAMEKLKKEESRIVKARYINHRGMNERLTKPYCRWAGESIRIFHLIPGYTYDLPMGFINEVNGNPGLANRSDKMDESGKPAAKDSMPTKLHELVAVSF